MGDDNEAAFRDDMVATKEAWSKHEVGPSLPARLGAEAIGTAILMMSGLGAAVLALPYNLNATIIVALGWGVAVLALIIAIGHISGAHFNPAVTVGLWAAGRFPGRDIAPYAIAQVVGAAAGTAVIFAMLHADPTVSEPRVAMSGMSIGFGEHSAWGVSALGALLAEATFTGLLVALILSATSVKAPAHQAPFTISLGLTMLIVMAIPLTNGALNPARATATALFAEPWALGQLWAWWVAPLAGGLIVGLLYRVFGAAEDLDTVQLVDAVTED